MNADIKSPNNELPAEIEAVAAMVTAARRDLIDGKSVDLMALEGEVDRLCKAIHADPPKNSRAVRKALAAIVNDLDLLEHALTEQHRQLEQNLAERTRKLAIEAYSDPDETPGDTSGGTPGGNSNG